MPDTPPAMTGKIGFLGSALSGSHLSCQRSTHAGDGGRRRGGGRVDTSRQLRTVGYQGSRAAIRAGGQELRQQFTDRTVLLGGDWEGFGEGRVAKQERGQFVIP